MQKAKLPFIQSLTPKYFNMKNSKEHCLVKTGQQSRGFQSERLPGLVAKKTIYTQGIAFCIAAAAICFCSCKRENKPTVSEQEISRVRAAVARFADKKNAIAAGYNVDVTGYRTQMGHHFLNGDLVDGKFEIEKPEVMLYAPYGSDTMKLVAVEYATPIADISHPPPVPEGFTGSDDVWEINTEFNLWTLHVWVGLDNADGIFASHNHKLP